MIIMEIDYLLSFKNHQMCKNLDNIYLQKFSLLIKNNKKGKRKNKAYENKKSSNILKEKIQISKEKIENKFSLLINKLDNDNFEKIIEEFVIKFKDINEQDYIVFQKYILKRIIKDGKFQDLFLDFFIKIKEIYSIISSFNEKIFVSLIELKFKYDYNILSIDQINENYQDIKDLFIDLIELNSEDNRINNINLIIKFIKNNYFGEEIISEIANGLIKTDFIPDIYKFINDEYISKIFKFTEFFDLLKEKTKHTMNNRYMVLLKSILENNNIQIDSEIFNKIDESSNIISDDLEFNNEFDICEPDLFSEIDLKTVESYDNLRSKLEIEISNILEEYLLIEDFNEINNFLQNQTDINEFIKQLYNFYFKNNLNNYDKFKSLFLNFRNSKVIKYDEMINILLELINSDSIFDYVNIQSKVIKLLEIFKLLQIKLDKNQDNEIKKILEETC